MVQLPFQGHLNKAPPDPPGRNASQFPGAPLPLRFDRKNNRAPSSLQEVVSSGNCMGSAAQGSAWSTLTMDSEESLVAFDM